ncbi:MAG: DISARM system helicase DrmA [Candidatus Competibacteraceae bacterium]
MTPADVRNRLIDALRTDLVGPALPDELLDQAPTRWYLTGFLAPLNASHDQRGDPDANDQADLLESASPAAEDNASPDRPTARNSLFPASLGLSVLVGADTRELTVQLDWGDYVRSTPTLTLLHQGGGDQVPSPLAGEGEGGGANDPAATEQWQRQPRRPDPIFLRLPASGHLSRQSKPVSTDPRLKLAYSIRAVPARADGRLPPGARVVSIFLSNERGDAPADRRDEHYVFQPQITVTSPTPLLPQPNLRGRDDDDDWDERVADLHYRDVHAYAVGHGVATEALFPPLPVGEGPGVRASDSPRPLGEGSGVRASDSPRPLGEGPGVRACHTVRTVWIPRAAVEFVAASPLAGVELRMETLAQLPDAAAARAVLQPLVEGYRDWIQRQQAQWPALCVPQQEIGRELLHRAASAAERLAAGLDALADPPLLQAFRLMNRAMARAARQRRPGEDPHWRPFQLAFILLNLRGLSDPDHYDRSVVDLLFFPTGGGKTEAYLGLAAFTLILRRLRNPGIQAAGLAVLMRYTLRLLTLDQLGRAAALICALELERQADPATLGDWPFEIGLWVGQAATPNRMGRKGDDNAYTARHKTLQFQRNDRNPAPIPLETCPWCGEKFTTNSFQLVPHPDAPTDLRVVCVNRACDFAARGGRTLPILSVDEPIYRRLPCFLIATVDKFAALPWTGEVGALFGRVDRYDREGFYGPCQPKVGQPLPGGRLPPPELIIQDELHLISGPLGTIAGLYETALDALCATAAETPHRPKIVASTATVRRAASQIRALFDRREVDIFPPPGLDRRDSFFAETHPPERTHPRLYVGVAAQGRSLKVVMLRTYLALMAAAQQAYAEANHSPLLPGEGPGVRSNPADPYMTLLGYFNSLRELGGSRRIVEDEVTTRLRSYGQRHALNEPAGRFADRAINFEVLELTSRVNTADVAQAKRRLDLDFARADRVDIALATNMISVGLDITRLGLMVILGQPKTSAEYIQASSRVGRDPARPGLVVTLLNIHRPRDRSHYERFAAYHQTFYRSVEATSVTPFAPRALDRALAAVVVGLARHADSTLTPPLGAGALESHRPRFEAALIRVLTDRATGHAALPAAEAAALRQNVGDRIKDLLDAWCQIAHEAADVGGALQYQSEAPTGQRLLYGFLHPKPPTRAYKFRANRSMRDVEPSVNLWLKTLDNQDVAPSDP